MTRYFLLRLVRGGPLVPARLMEIDHEPGNPDNKRDRWPPTITVVDIAGEIVPPELLTERFFWPRGHWKFAERISAAEYRYRFARMRWAERHRPEDPTLAPKRRVDPRQVPLPNFDRENAAK